MEFHTESEVELEHLMGSAVSVRIPDGVLRGWRTSTLSGKQMFCFKGIPYARPPVGPLRFKAPWSVEPWPGIRNALFEGPRCPSYDERTFHFGGAEDCLYLNVYTPRLRIKDDDYLKPVMVWIHGGGSSSSEEYGPDYLVDQGVTLVTLNYRLGPLGFLSLGNADLPGNLGLKDQVAALRWVKNNITAFGGDPENVTLFGSCFGAACVHLHMLSPMSKGLFCRAIAQSGSALCPWAISPLPVSRAFRLGAALGLTTNDSKELIDFLRAADPKDMVDASHATKTEAEKRMQVLFLFAPCVEPRLPDQEPFLAQHPERVVAEARYHAVPLLIGYNSSEMITMLREIAVNPKALRHMQEDFDRMVPNRLREIHPRSALQDYLSLFYFNYRPVSLDTLEELVKMNTDINFAYDIYRTVTYQATQCPDVPVYLYHFCFDGKQNYAKARNNGSFNIPGACHGDELGYLFRVGGKDYYREDSAELSTMVRLTKMWANFARTGNPTPNPSDEDIKVTWRPYTDHEPCHVRIGKKLTMGRKLEEYRMEFWDEMYRPDKRF